MAGIEEDILAEGAEIIWVLEETSSVQPGTAANCRAFMDSRGSDKGICVGDSETMPQAYEFLNSPFAIGRGFDIIVRRSTMEILWVTTHGTPAGNDNLDAQAILDAIRMF